MADINMNKVVGETFEDMSISEMALVQGAGDVNLETTPTIAVSFISGIISGVIASTKLC